MASKPKADRTPAESTQDAKRQQAEEAGAKLAAMLQDAEPKDAEQPTPVKDAAKDDGKKVEAAKEEKPAKVEKKKVLALNEIEGEVVDGGKVRIGVESYAEGGGEVIRVLTVPASWKIVGPAARPQWVHAMDEANDKRTLCTLATDWVGGIVEYPSETYITCQPCARRLIAIKKLTASEHEKRRKAREKAVADAKKEAERVAKAAKDEKAAKEKAAKEQAAKDEAAAKEAAKPVEVVVKPDAKAAEAKPDPKRPSAARTSRKRGQQAA